MGDMGSSSGGGGGGGSEKQFLEDLERATRLSLECYETEEKERRSKYSKVVKAGGGSDGGNGDVSALASTTSTTKNGRRLSETTLSTSGKLQNLEITPRPRPYSRGVSSSGGSSGGYILSPPSSAQVSSIPPPHPFKRHRSLPYRNRHATHPPIVSEVYAVPCDTLTSSPPNDTYALPSASDDLIFLASPKPTPKLYKTGWRSVDSTTTPLCDTSNSVTTIPTYSVPLDDLNGGTMTSRQPHPSIIRNSPSPSANVPNSTLSNNNIGFSNGSLPPGTTSAVIGGILHNLSKSSSPNGQPFVPFPRKLQAIGENVRVNGNQTSNLQSPGIGSSTSGSNLYKRLSAELKSMNQDDLIDFGMPGGDEQKDSRNILEHFDPLLIRENRRKEEEDLRVQREKDEREKRESSSSTITTTDPNSRSASSKTESQAESLYNASIGSAATSAFSYRGGGSNPGPPSLSLYPNLEEFEYDTVYGHLGGRIGMNGWQNASSDASSFYDVYNPFEYLYTVSCSTPSAASESLANISSQPHLYANVQEALEVSSRAIGFYFEQAGVSQQSAPALPPRNSDSRSSSRPSSPSGSTSSNIQLRIRSQSHDKTKRVGKLYENIESVKNFASTDSEIQAFYEMVREVRFSCRHVDSTTNKGYIRSPILESKCTTKGLSLKILVWPETFNAEPVGFTCDISSAVELVVEQSIVELEINGSGRDYILRVKGLNEYLDQEVPLGDYSYVQQCIKWDEDIQLVLVQRSSLTKNSWARTPKDDARSVNIEINDILPVIQAKTINYSDISIPLEVVDRESERIKEKMSFHINGNMLGSNSSKDTLVAGQLSAAPLMQAVKAVCTMLGEVVTAEIVHSLDGFVRSCDEWNTKVKISSPIEHRSFDSTRRARIGSDIGSRHSVVEIMPHRRNSLDENAREMVTSAVEVVISCVRSLVEMYSKSFPVSFRMKEVLPDKSRNEQMGGDFDAKPVCDQIESFLIRANGVHRLKPEWLTTYKSFYLMGEVYHGTRWMGRAVTKAGTIIKAENHWFFNTLHFDEWLNFDRLPICILPRESRVVFTLYGEREKDTPSEDSKSKEQAASGLVELGWASMQCFNFKGLLAQGDQLLSFWPVGLVQKRLGPAPNSSFSSDGNSPLLTIAFTDFGREMRFPEVPPSRPIARDFNSLDPSTQSMLKNIIINSSLNRYPPEDYEVLWEKRHYLHDFPLALPKVLLAARLWDYTSLSELHAILPQWSPLDPVDAIQLLLPCYPDGHVREQGIRRLSHLPDDELINLLPQLVEALSYETFDLSPLATFLLRRSLSSIPISHHLFWMLASQVGIGKWASQKESDPVVARIPRVEKESTYDPRRRRLELMLNSLMIVCGKKWQASLTSQFTMVQRLGDIALLIKSTSKDSARSVVLWQELQKLNSSIFSDRGRLCSSFPLPTSASTDVVSIHPNQKLSSYFNSNALPLKVSFLNGLPESGSTSILFKMGDDLRQDLLTLQTIRIIEKWWLREGMDLKVLTFSCVPTGYKQGMVEMVPHAETLRKIQSEHGVTGVFRDSAIAEWLAKMNPSTLDYRRAIDTFTLSCAAYCVLTYCLGIGDRHNDNIMLTKKGHLFHIDFGKFLGDTQMFINFKRDRTPFVLTTDMIYVINDGEKGSLRFHRFIEVCCNAFRIVRKNGNTFINLFSMMVTAGVPGVDMHSVAFISNALLPLCSDVEAAARFTRFIEESSQNWFTPVNFFIHSLGQFRFTSNSDNPTMLSFVPEVYNMEQEGKIVEAGVISFQKKYDPEKYYSYTIKIIRRGQTEWSHLHRSYKEFVELHSKLCINFPMAAADLKPLPRGGIARSNVKQMAQKRLVYIDLFLQSLFVLADEISHSNLVYTFFHPLLRDEEQHLDDEYEREMSEQAALSRDPSRIHGQIKLRLCYQRDALQVLICHAVDLACPNGQPPSPYVKTYLQPDNARVTKRKTPVIRRSKHPSFMELLEYRLPLEIIRQKILQVSVWHHDPLQENNFLGGISIPLAEIQLEKEVEETYNLGNLNVIN